MGSGLRAIAAFTEQIQTPRLRRVIQNLGSLMLPRGSGRTGQRQDENLPGAKFVIHTKAQLEPKRHL
jgi:hypothetical protein